MSGTILRSVPRIHYRFFIAPQDGLFAAHSLVPCDNRLKGACIVPSRKLIGFDQETLRALEMLSRDGGKSLQQLADEAFADLLAKHKRPRTLMEALKQSAKRGPANDNKRKRRR
jgi:hypothetical protein